MRLGETRLGYSRKGQLVARSLTFGAEGNAARFDVSLTSWPRCAGPACR
jgi:hypothetical protein